MKEENKQELISEIKKKREFSQLPEKDIELAFSKFEDQKLGDEEKFKKTRKVLHEVFGSVLSKKLFTLDALEKRSLKEILKKHNSTSERLDSYEEVYERIFSILQGKKREKKFSVIDLGCGINGMSYSYMEKYCKEYLGIESVKQVVDLVNKYFSKKGLDKEKFRTKHESLFNLPKIKEYFFETEKPRVVFLFKTVDALEKLKKNYSKEIIKELSESLGDECFFIVSFPVKSVSKGRDFKVSRKWFEDFLFSKENSFKVLDDFSLSGERYFVFSRHK